MDRLASMAAFVKAVDLGSFATAAVALDISAPMVGKHVRFLERRLGSCLIARTTRRQALTDVGRVYYERCRTVLAEVEAADRLASDQLLKTCGKLRVTMPVLLGRYCVSPILLSLARKYPKLELEMSFNDHIADLTAESYDLAIRTGDLGDRAGMIARRVAQQRMIVCASQSYIEARGLPQCPEDLWKHQAIVYRRSGRVRPWLFPQESGSPVKIMPVNRLWLDDLDAIAEAAVSGMGLAWLPSWLIRERIQVGALVPLLSDQLHFPYECHAVWLKTTRLPLKVRLAVDALVAGLPGLVA